MASHPDHRRAQERELRILRLRQRWLERLADKVLVGHLWACILIINIGFWLIGYAIARGLSSLLP